MPNVLESLRHRLARSDALIPLALVGAASGMITGVVIIVLRLLTESSRIAVLDVGDSEHFEGLSPMMRFALPVLGALVLGIVFQRAAIGARQVGVVHVMEYLANHAGRLPLRNAVLQALGATVSILAGLSIGREGPAVHVGAASSSLLGQWLHLPNNSIRILVACGTAASISASFDTPLAGVIFAMEVVMMEYTIVGFTPVIIAAVCATSLTRAVFGDASLLVVPPIELTSLWELPFILLVGVAMGTLAVIFIQGIQLLDRKLRHLPLWIRMTTAGLVTGSLAVYVPEIMGVGYDTVEHALLGNFALTALTLILAFKLVATIACVGLGIPAGLIGPTLVIGSVAGGAMGVIGHDLVPELSSTSEMYAMLGMGAMMGATLQAPLAAMMAILEITANPNSILPGMLVIVTATLTAKTVFKQDSIFVSMLRARGLEYRNDPVTLSLERTGVGAVMSQNYTHVARNAELRELRALRNDGYEWLLIVEDDCVVGVLAGDRLSRICDDADENAAAGTLDVYEASDARLEYVTVRPHAALREALEVMDETQTDVVLITRAERPTTHDVRGVLTRGAIDAGVRYTR